MSTNPRPLVFLVIVSAVAMLPRSAAAVPEALSKGEVACQDAMGRTLGVYAKARAACVARCRQKTPLSTECTIPFANKTLECVQKADAKLAALLATKCQSDGTDTDSCPECYETLSGNCDAFGAGVKASTIKLVDGLSKPIFCDDTASVDGLSKVEAKCQTALLGGLGGFVSKWVACVTTCVKKERKGKTDGSCNPRAFLNGSGGDTKASACLSAAFSKMSVAARKCQAPNGNMPECLSGTAVLFTTMQNGISDIGTAVEVCPAQCGDNFKQGFEECDGTDATACLGACTANCTCPH